jgi:enoyl-CoA hydratase/carnithine racemase
MDYGNYQRLRISVEDGICRVTVDNPPMNLLDGGLIVEFGLFIAQVAADGEVRVVIVDSADPDFFVAHADLELIQGLPSDDTTLHDDLSPFNAVVDMLRTMPKATIAVIEGIARGGGSELAMACDMRFAALGKAVLAQPEVAVGIIPGGGGTQRLPRLVGRARALELVLGCGDVDAATADAWGYVNRALAPEELRPYVDDLATRIASFPPDVVAAAKRAVDAAVGDPVPGLCVEDQLFRQTLTGPAAAERMRAFLNNGGQTREVETRELPLEILSPGPENPRRG